MRQVWVSANTSESAPAAEDEEEDTSLRVNDRTGVNALAFSLYTFQLLGLQIGCGFVVSPGVCCLLHTASAWRITDLGLNLSWPIATASRS